MTWNPTCFLFLFFFLHIDPIFFVCLFLFVQAEEEARRNRLMRDMAQLRLQVFILVTVP